MATPALATVVRPAAPADLPDIVGIYNHYVLETPTTFEIAPVRPDERVGWLDEHSRGGRHRIVVAATPGDGVVGWATSSRFRPRAAYDTTVESSVYCRVGLEGRGIGTALYRELFRLIAGEDIERIVAGITLPNPASVRLHARFGFRPVGTFHRIGRKFGRYWDVEWVERAARDPSRADGA